MSQSRCNSASASTSTPKEDSGRKERRNSKSKVLLEQWYDKLMEEMVHDLREKYASGAVVPRATMADFETLGVLGSGSFGVVLLVKHKGVKPRQYYVDDQLALKIQPKKQIIAKKQLSHVLAEKRILCCTESTFIPKLFFAFKDNANVFLVMEVAPGGDFFEYLQKSGSLPEHHAALFASQVVMTFEYLHGADILYRDLKPENLLLDRKGYLKVTDFGFAKMVSNRTYTLCGTPEYLAPEMLQSRPYGKSVDWWCLGILIYEMIFHKTPFQDKNESLLYRNIQTNPVVFPAGKCVSSECKQLISSLLDKDPSKRLGCHSDGVVPIRQHPWFSSIAWFKVIFQEVRTPYIPSTSCLSNLTLFKTEQLERSSYDLYTDEFKDF